MYNRDRDARRLYGGKKLRVGPVHAQGEHEDNDNHCYHEDPCDPDEVNDIYDCQKESAECDDSLVCKTRLNMFERALIEAVPRLPKKVGDSLIKASWDILDGNLSFGRGIEDFNDFLRTESGREDMAQILGLTVCGNDCVIFHIADAKALLQECLLKVKDIKTRPESATIPGSGARVYGEVAWGDWMLDTWNKLQEIHHGCELLPIASYSNKTLSRKGPKTLYPVNLFFPSAAIEDRFTQNAYRCIGHSPEPQPQGHLLPKKGMVMKNLKKWLMYTSLHLILEPSKNLSHTGVRLVNTKGETKTYFPIPVFSAADLLEYQTIFGISADPNDMDSYPDPSYLVRRRRLGKSIDTMPTRRSEILFQKRLDASRRLKDPEKAKEMLKEFSYDPLLLYTPEADTFGKQGKSVVTYYLGQGDASKGRIPSLPLAGFHLTNCFDLVVPDTLHTLHSGVGSYICNVNLKSASLLKTCMEMSGKHQANLLSKMSASIDESSPLREYSLPSVKFALPTDKNITVSSEQAANLCRLALVACLVDDALRPVVDVLQVYLELEARILCKHHTEDTLAKMHATIEKLKQALAKAFEQVSSTQHLNTLITFALYKFHDEVKRSACASVCDTHHHERTHKDLKSASAWTNNRNGQFMQQTLAKATQMARVAELIQCHEDDKRTYETSRIRALSTNRIQMVPNSRILHGTIGDLQNLAPYRKLQAWLPDMERLIYCINILYQTKISSSRTFKSHLILSLQIEIFQRAHIPFIQYPGCETSTRVLLGRIHTFPETLRLAKQHQDDPQNFTRSMLESKIHMLSDTMGSFVTVKGNGHQPWYAEILCFVRITPPSTSGRQDAEVAFVRWFTEVKKASLHPVLGLPYLKVEKTVRQSSECNNQTEVFTDLCKAVDILEPIYMQKDPSNNRKWFIHNRYVR